jgi:hypothetical protein
MEKAAAYAISAFIVGFGLWILIAGLSSSVPALWICAALIPIAVGAPERFRPHLKSIPFLGHCLCAPAQAESPAGSRMRKCPSLVIDKASPYRTATREQSAFG